MNRRMTSWLAIAGLSLTVLRWMRRRMRPSGLRRLGRMTNGMVDDVYDSMMHMVHRLRRRVRI